MRMDHNGTGSRRVHRAIWGVAFGLLGAFALYALFWRGGALDGFFNDWVYNALVVGSAASCLIRAAVRDDNRLAWALIGVGLSLWAAAELTNTLYLANLAEPPYPSIADAMWLGFYPLAYVALVLLVRGHTHGERGVSIWLDGLLAALTVAAIGEVIVVQPVLEESVGTWLEVTTDLAYPMGDLLLLALIFGVFAMTGWRPGHVWMLIAAGFTVAVVADTLYAFQIVAGTYQPGAIVDVMWPAATLLVGYAAWVPVGRSIAVQPTGLRVLVLPVLFGSTSLGLLVYDHFARIDDLALVLATLTMVTVLGRTAVTYRENLKMLRYSRREAMTDPLTGLGNRRRLMIDLMREIDDATVVRPAALVLYDLDGFKRYNDNYGHPAGDALLARLGHNLAHTVGPFGRAYRLGGDEFCALLRIDPRQADVLLEQTREALTERGPNFEVSSSHGIVFLPGEATEPSLAMQIADQRLYGNKGSRRRQAVNQQTRDVLLQVLHERQPDLHEHLAEVAELAMAIGRKLSLMPEELEEMARAAELHDVGKMAIPDEILNKPGPLDRVELGFVRQHTIVGERILAAAPSLSPVARIVRASHERWDGTGYPDGLKGDEIPLASRIIAACDAYKAMTSDRPYAVAVPTEEALAELRRCAGSHFDPRVVEVLCAEVEAGSRKQDSPDPAPLDPTIDLGELGVRELD
jgi:diguanylate cyclase (GGDEF)-like protein